MRDHYEALGKVASAAIANSDNIVESYSEFSEKNGDHAGLTIETNHDVISVIASPTAQTLQIIHQRRFSFLDSFNVNELPHIDDALEHLQQSADLSDFDGTLEPVPISPENDPVEYFDGLVAKMPIYIYDTEFSMKQYRNRSKEVFSRAQKAMKLVEEEFEIEMDAEGATDEQDDEPDEFGHAFA